MYVFKTETSFDFRSVSVMGLSAKPEVTNAIGKFGTGLKYAIAIVMRLGGTFVIHHGDKTYSFETRTEDFRGKDYQAIVCKIYDYKTEEHEEVLMPFTTNYGMGWQPWMVLRELISNTLDEKGTYFYYDKEDYLRDDYVDGTAIHVECERLNEIEDHGKNVFLDKEKLASYVIFDNEIVTIYDVPAYVDSKYIYNDGIRVQEPPYRTRFLYNLKGAPLSEDRQLSGGSYVIESAWRGAVRECILYDNPDALDKLLSYKSYKRKEGEDKFFEEIFELQDYSARVWEDLYVYMKDEHSTVLGRWMNDIIKNAPLHVLEESDRAATAEQVANFNFAVDFVQRHYSLVSKGVLVSVASKPRYYAPVCSYEDVEEKLICFIAGEHLNTRSSAVMAVIKTILGQKDRYITAESEQDALMLVLHHASSKDFKEEYDAFHSRDTELSSLDALK